MFIERGFVIAALWLVVVLAAGLWLFRTRRGAEPPTAGVAERAPTRTVSLPQPRPVTTPQSNSGIVSSPTLVKLKVLDEIFVSRNDNDPRLDTDFRQLSSETKAAMREKYRSLPVEKRNERGTIVFLLGRNLTAPEDVAFLQGVLQEKPCLSLTDCAVAPKAAGTDEDASLGINVTRAYPQIVALKSAEQYLRTNGTEGSLSADLHQVVNIGEKAADATIAQLAHRIRTELPQSR